MLQYELEVSNTSIFHQLAFWLGIVSFYVIIYSVCLCVCVCVCVCLSSGIHHTTSFLIKNIQQVWYSWFEIGVAPKFFWADSRTLNTPHTTGRSDKQLYLGLSEVENSDQNRPVYIVFSAQLSPHSSKYLLQCSAEERNSYRFRITVWVNDEGILIFR